MSRRTAANASKYSCASVQSCTNTSAASIPNKIVFQQPEIIFHDHLVHDHLGEHGKEQLQHADGDREAEHLQQNRF